MPRAHVVASDSVMSVLLERFGQPGQRRCVASRRGDDDRSVRDLDGQAGSVGRQAGLVLAALDEHLDQGQRSEDPVLEVHERAADDRGRRTVGSGCAWAWRSGGRQRGGTIAKCQKPVP